ncbi:MAG: hypothetical protein KR126chlam5_00405 [Candidatus Anoxychlamydiales bacterium]|nr:hypothetical protein [Candidatus Anoxychlamydiales bacterium]
MKSILKKIFIDNWLRKILALIIGIITWFFINNSLTVTKTVGDIPVKVINLADDKTIPGMLPGGALSESHSVTITGNQNFINQINANDLEILIDLKNRTHNFTTLITKHNLISKKPTINLERSIKKVISSELTIKLSRLVKEKIPVLITKPIGEAPKGYQFLDVWPFQLNITLMGAEEIIKNLKAKGLQLTFDLSDISQNELDIINAANKRGKKDIVSFFIPTVWKKINIPSLSPYPMEIEDPNSKALRLDFIKNDLIPIDASIPVSLFFPPSTIDKFNPDTITLENTEFLKKINNYNMITTPLLAQGVSEDFISVIKERMHIVILVDPKEDVNKLVWNTQVIIPIELEAKFVNKKLAEETDAEAKEMEPHMREAYQKNIFRSYINLCRLYISPGKKLNLEITLVGDKVQVIPNNL